MTKREVVQAVLAGENPPYVPWSFGFTLEAHQKLVQHYGTVDLETILDNHLLRLGNAIGFFEQAGDNLFRDVFGVVWDRTVDKDIGIVSKYFDTALFKRSFVSLSNMYSSYPSTVARWPEDVKLILRYQSSKDVSTFCVPACVPAFWLPACCGC